MVWNLTISFDVAMDPTKVAHKKVEEEDDEEEGEEKKIYLLR